MRTFDLICVGRAAVDLYGEQIGSPLEAMQSFAMSLGGCPANIAVGSSRLGLRVSMLTRVGDEHLGRFVRESLQREGVGVSHVSTDPSRLTALVVLGIRDQDTFPLIFYRENCADMALEASDFDRNYIASAEALLVTGTHFSRKNVDQACRQAIAWAKLSGTRVIFDIDYRPVLWGLTGHGRGEDRYVRSNDVSAHLQSIVADCDLVVGTEEEIHVAGGSEDTITALRALRALSPAVIVLKRGALGCAVFEGAIPDSIDQAFVARGVPVQVLNVLGAGDAFMAGFLRGWLRNEGLERATAYANAAGALVVSRHGCSPAMPTWEEMNAYLARAERIARIDLDPEIAHLHRVTTRDPRFGELAILAFDHRVQLLALASATGAPPSRLTMLKHRIAEAARSAAFEAPGLSFGAIVDEEYGRSVLDKLTGSNLWLARPIEKAGAPTLTFLGGPDVGLTLRSWPRDHVVKCLVYAHPEDDAERSRAQEERLVTLSQAAIATGHELLLELIPKKGSAVDERALSPLIDRYYALGIRPDWWKLPAPRDSGVWGEVSAAIWRGDKHCRGILILGLDAPPADVAASFRAARDYPMVRGFAVGRTIFAGPAEQWLAGRIDDLTLHQAVADRFRELIEAWRTRKGDAG